MPALWCGRRRLVRPVRGASAGHGLTRVPAAFPAARTVGAPATMLMRHPQGLPGSIGVGCDQRIGVAAGAWRVRSSNCRAHISADAEPPAVLAGVEAPVARSGERGCPCVCGQPGLVLTSVCSGLRQVRRSRAFHAGHADGRGPPPDPARWRVGVSCGGGGTLGSACGSGRSRARDDESRGALAAAWQSTPVHDSILWISDLMTGPELDLVFDFLPPAIDDNEPHPVLLSTFHNDKKLLVPVCTRTCARMHAAL